MTGKGDSSTRRRTTPRWTFIDPQIPAGTTTVSGRIDRDRDLGADRDVRTIELDVLHDPGPLIYAPTGVTVGLAPSASGPIPSSGAFTAFTVPIAGTSPPQAASSTAFRTAGVASDLSASVAPLVVRYRIAGTGTGRYVKVHLPNPAWLFVAEVRVFGP